MASTMRQAVHDRLASRYSTHEVVRRLHDVPPHEVDEVRVDGRRVVYKGNVGPTGRAGTEGRVTAFVDAHTTVPVPTVLHVGAAYYVAAWQPDAPAPDAGGNADEAWVRAAGRTLATLHEKTAPLLDGYGRLRPGDDRATADREDWHAAAVAYVRRRRPVLAEYGHADVADAVLGFLDERPDAFAGAGDPVCCHGWATPEHVAVADGETVCVVDFEHALAAPGEYDYWRTVVPTFAGDGEDRAAFREAYESVRSLPEGLDRRGPFYALLNGTYYFESLYVQDQHDPEETRRRAERLRERVFERLDSLR